MKGKLKMNEIVKIYKNYPVRIVQKNSEPWFVAKDIAEILEYAETSVMLRRLFPDELEKVESTEIVGSSCRHGGSRQMTIISEAGLYNAILGSNKPEAKNFQRWVTHEVLPSIRKTGAYIAPNLGVEVLGKIVLSIKEQYEWLIKENSSMRQKLEYALQFIPKSKYGEKSKRNGQRQTTIRRGANVAGNGRLIEHRDPDEVGYSVDLLGEYLPRLLLADAVNIININCPRLLESANA